MRLELYLEAVDIKRARCCDCIHQLVNLHLREYDMVKLPCSSQGELALDLVGRQAGTSQP